MSGSVSASSGPVRLLPLVDAGLGNSAYLVDLGDGRALVVDAGRDLRALRATADEYGLKVAFAADTHLHADFLSGSLQLAHSDAATVLASAVGRRTFAHRALADGDEVDLGGLTLRTLATPGHTHEHIAFELLDGANTVGVFTGGSLLVGSAARTDLVAPERTEELARAQYRSLQRLARLDDHVAVWPTHGPGSFCSAPPGAQRTSSIGAERATNQLLRADSEDAFVEALLASLGTYPPYFDRLGELNRVGPPLVVDGDCLHPLGPQQVQELADAGSPVLDVRPVDAYARAHVPGSVSIPLREAFATWLGWLIAPGRPLVVVRDSDQDPAEILWQARKVGYDLFAGELACGMTSWTAAGLPTATIPLVAADALKGATVLDIRQAGEFTAGHVPGAAHVELGALAGDLPTLPPEPLVVMCGHGERAMSAASLLARAGRRDVAVLAGGPGDWAATTNRTLETGR